MAGDFSLKLKMASAITWHRARAKQKKTKIITVPILNQAPHYKMSVNIGIISFENRQVIMTFNNVLQNYWGISWPYDTCSGMAINKKRQIQ